MSNTFARPRPRTLGRGAAIVAGAIVALSQAVTPVLATEFTPLPAAPALLGPADGASGQAGPLFRWSAVPHAWTYRLEVFRDSAMTGIPACSQETILRSARCPAELPPDTYYWRVRSLTVTSKGGLWSPTRLYVKTPRALPAPAITAPATGTVLAYPAGLALLRWTPVANAYDYQVQLSTSSTFPAGPATGVALETHVTAVRVPADVVGSARYWRVRARTANGTQVSVWSPARTFRVTWTESPAPISPDDGAAVSTQVIAWAPIAGAATYEVQLTTDGDPSFASPVGTTGSDMPWATLAYPDGTVRRWRVRGITEHGAPGPWSASRVYTVDAEAPAAPDAPALDLPAVVLTGPSDGDLVSDPFATPLDYDPVPGATRHQLQVVPVGTPFPTEDPTPSDVTTGLGPIARQLDGGTEYKWRVRSWATQTITGPWSEIHTFTTPAVIPIAMTGPADGVTVDLDDLALTWTPVAGQPAMYVQVSATPDFDAPTERAVYADGGVPWPGPAEAGTWYWRVLAGRDAIVARSPVRSLTIEDDTPPAGLVGFPAARGSAPYDSISLEWRAEDLLSDVATVAISGNGTDWEERDWIGVDQAWSLTQPVYGTDPGRRDIWVRFRDGAGNWSTPLRQWTIYEPEAQPLPAPAVTGPRATVLANEPLVDGRPALLLRWTASFDGWPLVGWDLERRVDGDGAWTTVKAGLADSQYRVRLTPGHSYQYRVRANGPNWVITPWVSGPTFRVSRYAESSPTITWRGTWATVRNGVFWGGAARRSATAGSKASIVTSARELSWIARRGPDRGKAKVYVNGSLVATIDLWAPTYRPQVTAWTGSWTTATERRVTVLVEGTAGRPRVEVDGFIGVR